MNDSISSELKYNQNSIHRCIRALSGSYSEAKFILASHAAFPMILTTNLLYCIWSNFQFDINGNPLNIPWLNVSDILLSGLFEESWSDVYQLDKSTRDFFLYYLEFNPNFGVERLKELARFLLSYTYHQPKTFNLDDQDILDAQRRTALVYLEPDIVIHELALNLSKEYRSNDSEVIRIASQIETLSVPIKRAKYESLLEYAQGMKELVYQEKTENFSGLIQLEKDPQEVRDQFNLLLRDNPLYFLPEAEELINSTQSISEIIYSARKSAKQFGNSFIASEHILLGILLQTKSWTAQFLNSLGVLPEALKTELGKYYLAADFKKKELRIVSIFKGFNIRPLPLASCSRRIFAFSKEEAYQLGQSTLNGEHLLLGIIREGDNLASVFLDDLEIDPTEIRRQVIRQISSKTYTIPYSTHIVPKNLDDYSSNALTTLGFTNTTHLNRNHRDKGYISTELILLRILKEEKVASIVAACSSIDLEEDIITVAQKYSTHKRLLVEDEGAFTPRVKRALLYAQEELEQLGHYFVDTTHLLLGLIREQDNAASTILASLKVNYSQLRILLRDMADVEQHESKDVQAIRILTNLSVDLSMIRPQILSRLDILTDLPTDLSTDEKGRAIQVLINSDVDLSVIRSQILSRLEFLASLSTDEKGRAIQVLINSDVDLSVIRSQVLSRLEFLASLSTDEKGRAIQILINSDVDLAVIRSQVLKNIQEDMKDFF